MSLLYESSICYLPKLEPIFEISGVDLKGKLVQVLDFSGTKDKKSQLKMKISDGDTWIEVFLDNVYRHYLHGKMLEENHLVTIVDYTGSIEMNNLVLVSYYEICFDYVNSSVLD